MTTEIADLWDRALCALQTASSLVEADPDAAASRAYYAAYYAASAYFAFTGRTFRKHSALEAAVHRDLVKAGAWSEELGAAFSDLAKLRATADYGAGVRVSLDEARMAVEKARCIVHAVREISPEPLP